jgi:hypothetical protein
MRACEDWDMWRRVVLDHRIAYLDEGLMRGRVHNQNMSSNRWLMRRHIFKHLLKMSFELPADLRRLRVTLLDDLFRVRLPQQCHW